MKQQIIENKYKERKILIKNIISLTLFVIGLIFVIIGCLSEVEQTINILILIGMFSSLSGWLLTEGGYFRKLWITINIIIIILYTILLFF